MVLTDGDGRTLYYVELQPEFEWKDEAASHVLYVHLPGFVWEQLKLTSDEPTRSLNVRGQHTIGTHGFVRLNRNFRIPDSARFKEMQSRFQSETLIVTIPKQMLVSPPRLPPLPPQTKEPVPAPTPHNEPPKVEGSTNDGSREGDTTAKLPTVAEKVAEPERDTKNRVNDGGTTIIPPPSLPPLPMPALKPHQIPTPRAELPKEERTINDGPSEHDSLVKSRPLGEKGAGSGVTMIHLTEMKVGMEEERKLMVNVVMAAIVLVATGAYICYYTMGLLGRDN